MARPGRADADDRSADALRLHGTGNTSCCHSAARPRGITTDYPERIGT